MRGEMNKRGLRAPMKWSVAAAISLASLVVAAVPAAADEGSSSPSPTPQATAEVSPSAETQPGIADEPDIGTAPSPTPAPESAPSAAPEVDSGRPADGLGVRIEDGAAPSARSVPSVRPQSTKRGDGVAPSTGEGLYQAETIVVPSGQQHVVVVDEVEDLTGAIIERAQAPFAPGDSVFVGAARASLGDLAGSLFGPEGRTYLAAGRPDQLAQALPRASAGEQLSVEVLPQLQDSPIPGAAFAVSMRLNEGFDAGWVDAAFDISGVEHAYGGDYGQRLQLVVLPECSLTTPERQGCLVGVPLETSHAADGVLRAFVPAAGMSVIDVAGLKGGSRLVDVGAGKLTSRLPTNLGIATSAPSQGGTIIAAVSGASSQAGDFSVTDLAPAGTWGVTEPAGGFTYALPIAVPPTAAGSTPALSLDYSSQATDGKTAASNNQAGIVGEGWSMPVDFIERLDKPCVDDSTVSTHACWDSPYSGKPAGAAYVMSLRGQVEELVLTSATGDVETYTPASTPSLKVTRYAGTVEGRSGNGDDNGEYFMVEDQSGAVYYFGYNPETETGATSSVAWKPVWGNHSGEPGFGTSSPVVKHQAYRWYLDVSVDASSNAVTYFYSQATNKFTALNPQSGSQGETFEYVRDTQLSRIEYGQVFDEQAGSVTAAEAKVEFDLVGRCVERAQLHDPLSASSTLPDCGPITSATAASYPDVPADLMCGKELSEKCNPLQSGATYFSTVRLNQINTYVRDVADEIIGSEWVPVETTQLIVAFPATRDGSARSLWLDSVYTRGWGQPGTDTDDVDTYLTKFSGLRLNNRVDWDNTPATSTESLRALDRMRINHIWTDLGGRIDVTYAQADDVQNQAATRTGNLAGQVCPQNGRDGADWAAWSAAHPLSRINSAQNSQLCFAVGGGANMGIYHNYVVTKVELVDLVGGQPEQTTSYVYGGDPAYGKPDSLLYAPGATGDDATFSSYRGFLTVSSTSGDVPEAEMVVPVTSLRSGDFDGDGQADLFTVDASGQWMFSSGGTGPWANLFQDGTVPLADLRFGDFNGDGKTDVFSRTSSGQWRYSSGGATPWINLATSGYPLSVMGFGDFNADGKTDVFIINGTQWQYSSAGLGNWINLSTSSAARSQLGFADVNGDGKTDVVGPAQGWTYTTGGNGNWIQLNPSPPTTVMTNLHYGDFDGDGKDGIIARDGSGEWWYVRNGSAPAVSLASVLGSRSVSEVLVGDFTGDGKADVYVQDSQGRRQVWSVGQQGLQTIRGLDAATDAPTTTNQYFRGVGGTINSLYDGAARTDVNPGDVRLQGMLESSITVDGSGAVVSASKSQYTVTQRATVVWDRTGASAVHQPHVVQPTSSLSKQIDGEWSTTTESSTVFDPVHNLPTSTTVVVTDNASGQTSTQCSSVNYAANTDPYVVVAVEQRAYEGNCAAGILVGRSQVGYDGATPGDTAQTPTRGLVTEERTYTSVSEYTSARATYDAHGRIAKAWMPNDVSNSDPSMTWAYGTDGALWTTQVTQALGATTTTWSERGHGGTVRAHGATNTDWSHYQYDGLGLLVAGWAPGQWGQQATPDLATTVPTVLYRYDVYADGPSMRATPAVVTTAPFVGDTGNDAVGTANNGFLLTDEAGTQRRSFTFLDGWGRAIEQHNVAPSGDGGRTVTATRYDRYGRVAWSSAPFHASNPATIFTGAQSSLVNPALVSIPRATSYGYDTLGRAVSTTSLALGAPVVVNGTPLTTSVQFAGPVVTTTAPDGSSVSSTTDLLGRTIEKVIGADSAHAGQADQVTSYEYETLTGLDSYGVDRTGFQRVTVTDPEGNDTVFTSNLVGQRITLKDPNSGDSSYEYDANGQVVKVTSAAGETAMTYDVLGRLVARTSIDPGGQASSSAYWDFVEPGETGAETDLGLLRSTTSTTHTSIGDFTTVSTTAYDALHRPIVSTVTLPDDARLGDLAGQAFTTQIADISGVAGSGYDALGQVTDVTMPAMGGLPVEVVSTGYRLSGSPETLTLASGTGAMMVSTPVVTGVAYNGVGQLVSRTYGNGVSRSYQWDASTGSLTGLSALFVTEESGSAQTVYVQDETLVRDAMGRVVSHVSNVPVADGAGGGDVVTAECFTYDGFNRLSAAWTVAGSSAPVCGSQAPSEAGSPGWDGTTTAYAQSWTHSVGGRITAMVEGSGAGAVTATYTYEDGAHPSAVTGVNAPAVAGTPAVVSDATDDFEAAGYAGGSGWSGAWAELGDDADAAAGVVQVADGMLSLAGVGVPDTQTGVTRSFDATGAASAAVTVGVLSGTNELGASDALTVTVMADGDPARVVTGGVDGTAGLPVVSDPANPPAAAQVTVDASSLLPASELTITLSIDQGSSATNTVETGEAFLVDGVDVEVAPMVLGARDVRADGFAYDEAGRMVSRTVNGVRTALVWDVMSNLVESDGAGGHVVYVYDASGQRVAQLGLGEGGVAGSATAYVGGGQVTDPDTSVAATGDTNATRYYTFGGATVAVRTDDGQLALMLGDEQGSTSVMMPVVLDGSGAMVPAVLADATGVVRTAYTPYGQLRGADNVAVDRGWLGQVEDSGTGLTYLNARYYDPALQRFLSPDPLMSPGDPRTLDAYRYAENNPVVFTDASGLFAACSGVSGAAEAACLSSYYAGTKLTPPTKGVTATIAPPSRSGSSAPSTVRPGRGSLDTGHGTAAVPGQEILPDFTDPEFYLASLATGGAIVLSEARGVASKLMRAGQSIGGMAMSMLRKHPWMRHTLRISGRFTSNLSLGAGDATFAAVQGLDNYYFRYSEVEDTQDRLQFTIERTIVTEGSSLLVGHFTDRSAVGVCIASATVWCAPAVALSAFIQTGVAEMTGTIYDQTQKDRVAAASGNLNRYRRPQPYSRARTVPTGRSR